MADTRSVSLSDRGRRRSNNEDFAAHFEPDTPEELEKSGCLYIIADGVGGAAKGERASQFAAQKLLYEYFRQTDTDDPGERLREILETINDEIHAFASENRTRMATTIVAAVVRDGLLHVVNVGDSRAYLIHKGEAKQLNRDHSLVGEMVAHGEMTEAEAAASNIKNRLTRSLGGEGEVHVDDYPPIELEAGDKILLCTDGLTRYALRPNLESLTAEGSLEEIARRLVDYANQRGGADNITVVMVSYKTADVSTPTTPIARPESVDLQTLTTQPDLLDVSRRQRAQLGTLITLGAIALVLTAVIGFMAIRGLGMLTSGASASASAVLNTTAGAIVPTETTPSQPAPGALVVDTPIPPTVSPIVDPPSPTVQATPTQEGALVVVGGKVGDKGVNIRSGPSTEYEKKEQLSWGHPFWAIGRNDDSTWLYVRYGALDAIDIEQADSYGWVKAGNVELQGQIETLRIDKAATITPTVGITP